MSNAILGPILATNSLRTAPYWNDASRAMRVAS
jgi:hypothetical protein